MGLITPGTGEVVKRDGYIRETLLRREFERPIGNMGIFRVKIPQGGEARAHFHRESLEIFIFLNEAILTVNGKEYEAARGDVAVIEAGEVHSVRNKGNSETSLIVIKLPNVPGDKEMVD